MHLYSFEKLDAWQEGKKLVVELYKITGAFPAEERFGITMQIRRASISVVSNIAEGSARSSAKDQAHFYQVAYSSLIEILNQLIIAQALTFINEKALSEVRTSIEGLLSKIAALRNAQLSKVNAASTPKP
jgi:four helix bundle protein